MWGEDGGELQASARHEASAAKAVLGVARGEAEADEKGALTSAPLTLFFHPSFA
jgi:hypothetical protein